MKSSNAEYGIIYHLSFPNGDYIGQTIQGEQKRWKGHLRDMRAGSPLPVHNAMRKYYNEDPTINKVKMIVIDKASSLEELNNLEKKYISKFNTFNANGKNPNGYNLTIGGDGCGGYLFTEEQKENCRKVQQKRKEEHPEIAVNHAIMMKQRAMKNPDIGIRHAAHLIQFYQDNPQKKEEMSILKKKQNEDNPEMSKRQSEIKLMRYEDNDADEIISKIRNKSIQQWDDPEKRQKIMDEKRKRFSKPFDVYKDGILIKEFDYVPDCAIELFNNPNGSNISAALKGRRKHVQGYTFVYK